MEISQEFFDVLACPKCKGKLSYSVEPVGLICESCELHYPIRDGVPVMLVDEASHCSVKKSG